MCTQLVTRVRNGWFEPRDGVWSLRDRFHTICCQTKKIYQRVVLQIYQCFAVQRFALIPSSVHAALTVLRSEGGVEAGALEGVVAEEADEERVGRGGEAAGRDRAAVAPNQLRVREKPVSHLQKEQRRCEAETYLQKPEQVSKFGTFERKEIRRTQRTSWRQCLCAPQ